MCKLADCGNQVTVANSYNSEDEDELDCKPDDEEDDI